MRRALAPAFQGVLAALAGIAAGHLTAAFLNPAASPVLAVGSTVIDLTPTPMKEWAVREFGTADKPILIGSVLAGALVLAALAGVVARRRFVLGAGMLLGLVAVTAAMALSRPVAQPVDVLPALAAALVGLPVLRLLAGHSETAGPAHPEGAARAPARPSRRGLLLGTAVAAAAVALGGAGEWVVRMRTRIGDVVLPPPAEAAAPLPTGLEQRFPGISDFRTANDDFYRVDINLTVPIVPVDDWELSVDGMVDDGFSLTFDEFAALPLVERDITLTCVSNEVGGRYVGSARWLGVPLATLLDRAGVRRGADQLLSTAVDGFTISTPLAAALDGRDAMVAIGMNGDPLPAEHGFPARLVTPGLYGFVGATKWLERLTLTTYDEREAYWTERGWATDAPIKVAARIDTPRPLARIKAGGTVIGGVAWAQHRGIAGVEVRIDGGPWRPARLGPSAGIDYWRQWYLPWDAAPGEHRLAVRAATNDGDVQTAVRASPFPAGSSGIQEIVVTAT